MWNSISGFYLKYRVYILTFLLVFIGLELVNHFVVNKLHEVPTQVIASSEIATDPPLFEKSNGSAVEGGTVPREWVSWLPLILLITISSIIFLFQRWKGVDKFFLGFVLLRAGIVGSRRSGFLKWRIILSNRKSESITFSEPIMVFAGFRKRKKYKINSQNFPITLTTKTSHTLTIELNQFYHRVPELASYRFVRTEIQSSNGKVYKSFWRVLVVRVK